MYDQDYYEDGILTGKSCYENYRWIPGLTIPMAMTMIDYLGMKRNASVLDFGCAKGYLTKALRWLSRDAQGYDTSVYALANADPEIKPFVSVSIPFQKFKYCIAKDVFEHIDADSLAKTLEKSINAKMLFAVIPLGDDGTYRAPVNNLDPSHITCEPEEWWQQFFYRCGWMTNKFTLRIDGIKDKYYKKYPKAHGFFTLVK